MKETEKILLRRKHKVIPRSEKPYYEQEKIEKSCVAALLKNVQSLGFTFSRDLLEELFCMTRKELEEFYADIIPELKSLVGADVEYNPMYPDFPRQVAEASDAELFINAIIHYWTFGTVMPEYRKSARFPLIDDNKMTVLSVGNRDDIKEIFGNFCLSKTSLSEQDKQDIITVVSEYPDYMDYLPDEIPLKENAALIGKLIMENGFFKSTGDIKKYFKTATDVLRLVTALSDGDLSLAKPVKFRSMKRWERWAILDLLSSCGNIKEDMWRYRERWLRIAERIHPFEFKKEKYAKVNEAFDSIRNQHKPLMFGGRVELAMQRGDVTEAVSLLISRPGEFARRLDKLLRESKSAAEKNFVIESFVSVADEVSTPVLLQVREYFITRTMSEYDPVRVFFPKGNTAKAKVIKNELPFISPICIGRIARICSDALIKQYAERPALGNVYVDQDFINYLVPFSQRSASKATRTVVRGSELSISENAKAIRGFIWWTNTGVKDSRQRVDIDLSAAIFDENWRYVEHVSYTNLRSQKYRAYHSGDITNGGRPGGKGVAEFLDVDIDAVAKNAGRYIVYQVFSFTGQKFSDIPNVRFGWMEREDVNSGEIFEPSTVEMKMDLTAESTIAVPVIFDCVERRFIWCDMNLGIGGRLYRHNIGNNIENNLTGIAATCYGMTHLRKPNLFDLVVLNILARGKNVNDRNQADIIFSNDTTPPVETVDTSVKFGENAAEEPAVREKTEVPIITAFDLDYIVGNLL